jgi:hypothetical protein
MILRKKPSKAVPTKTSALARGKNKTASSRLGKDAPFPIVAHEGPFPKAVLRKGLYPEYLGVTTLYQGAKGPTAAVTTVARCVEEVANLLVGTTIPAERVQSIDFKQFDVIVVGLGEKSSGEYVVNIDSVILLTDTGASKPVTEVHYRSYQRSAASDVVTFPSHWVRVAKLPSESTIQFNAN